MKKLLSKPYRGQLFSEHMLAEFTSWHVGGPAEWLYIPADSEDLVNVLQDLPNNIPVMWLGLGSNVLIRDGGIDGVVIITQGGLNKIHSVDTPPEFSDMTIIRAEAGVSCGTLARTTARQSLQGLEFMAGIPGTVGGALQMNAGCYGGETWDHVAYVETINHAGERHIRKPEAFQISYRHVKKPEDEWFLAGYFKLQPGDKTASLTAIRTLLEKRNASQPTGLPNCGSVFRNPEGNYAARLIESCHLKGVTQGGAMVSEKHANFIINTGNATAHDIETLIERIQQTVLSQCHVQLIREVCIIGKSV